MAKLEIKLPAMGEGVNDATLTKWFKNEGDTVEVDETICEMATDKVDNEIPSPAKGILSKKLFAEGELVKVGGAFAILEVEGADNQPETKVEELPPPFIPNLHNQPKQNEVSIKFITKTTSGKFLSPLVRSIAEQENISIDELDKLNGTGESGRLTKADVLNYLERKNSFQSNPPQQTHFQEVVNTSPRIEIPIPQVQKTVSETKTISYSADVEVVKMDRIRTIIAESMVRSKHTSPHVTSFVELDVTNLVNWRNKMKDEFQRRENQKLTFTPLFVEAAAKALRDFPLVNVSVDGTNILLKKNINIGMATALPSGNLIVPVIKNADQLNIIGLAKSVNDLADRARKNKLKPDDIQGGTFTITNFGTFGNITGTPIINQPEVAILGVGSIVKKPAVIETPSGDAIAIRHIMILSLSYDHRVVDGALGGMFLKRIADYLEKFDINRMV